MVDDLAAAYQANADHAAETNGEWSAVSMEANQYLGKSFEVDDEVES